jgi:hypothetical protein
MQKYNTIGGIADEIRKFKSPAENAETEKPVTVMFRLALS